MPWLTAIPPIPVVIEGGILDTKERGMPVPFDAGMPFVIAWLAIKGVAGGLLGGAWGGELRFSPPKLWASRLTGGTPAQTHMDGEELIHSLGLFR